MKTLIINTYAGSLLLGANAIRGANIIGSFEDCGFGAKITKANRARFAEATDDFLFVDHIKAWPQLDLSDTIVLAHPPCAAFSQQNTSAAKRGVNTDAFECTRKVLHYAMSNNAMAIAVESVMGALAGAWDVHEAMAERGGYHVYRIVKNSLLFGVPQFRERFWCVFVRKDHPSASMTWRLAPKLTTVGAAIDRHTPGSPVDNTHQTLEKFIQKLVREHGLTEAQVRAATLGDLSGTKREGFSLRAQRAFWPNEDPRTVCRRYVSPFTSAQPSILPSGGFAPVLLGSSLWVYKGEPVSKEGYCAIMGFPADYIFPADKGHGVRTFLSKGVCPPVATWILDNLRMHFGEPSGSSFTSPGGYVKVITPGRIASFRPGRTTFMQRLEQLDAAGILEDDEPIELRDEETDLMEDHDDGEGHEVDADAAPGCLA